MRGALSCLIIIGIGFLAVGARAAELSLASGAVGPDLDELRIQLDAFEAASGHKVTIVSMPPSTTGQFAQYRLWLAAGNADIDVYRTDIIWAPQLAAHFIDLLPHVGEDIIAAHIPAIIRSQTVAGRLVALPMFADAPALYYRKDLLAKYGLAVPHTWRDLAAAAKTIQAGERAAGNPHFWGFVWQGAAYEGLTCNALEWVNAYGGGRIVEPDGTISINNPHAAEALSLAASWVGTISPPGVLAYREEEARGVWQTGNAAFMRNWPYAYAQGAIPDAPVRGKYDVAPLPAGAPGGLRAATLGGSNLAVSKYSRHPQAAIALVKYLTTPKAQKDRAIANARLPTIASLYDDPEIAARQPIVPRWKAVVLGAISRPSAATGHRYNEVSKEFWNAVHATLSGELSAGKALTRLEARLRRLMRRRR